MLRGAAIERVESVQDCVSVRMYKRHLICRATLASAHSERKVSRDSQGSRVVLEAPVILALAMWEHRASAESLVRLVSLGCQGNLDNLGQEVSDASTGSHQRENEKADECVREKSEKNKERIERAHG